MSLMKKMASELRSSWNRSLPNSSLWKTFHQPVQQTAPVFGFPHAARLQWAEAFFKT